MIISAFPGAGKTYLAAKYKDIIDLESMDYHWIYPDELKELNPEEKKRNYNRKENPMWPGNYLNDIIWFHKEGKTVLISGADWIVKELRERGYRCLNIYPDISQKEDYLKRYEGRGNNQDYIDFWDTHFEEYIVKKKGVQDDIVMRPGEYLEDVLKRIRKGTMISG